MTHKTFSEQQTTEFGIQLSKTYPPPRVFLLFGGLGAGKTAMARGLAMGYGASDVVCSPTFALMNQYQIPCHRFVYHFDLYRLTDHYQLDDIGFDDYLNDICIVEWPDKFMELMPSDAVKITIEIPQDNCGREIFDERVITVDG